MNPTTGVRSACHLYLPTDSFARATDEDLDRLDPCGFCFPDGEVDQPVAVLVVAGDRKEAESIHRDESTGDLEWPRPDGGGTDLAARLENPEFGFEDIPQSGGDA